MLVSEGKGEREGEEGEGEGLRDADGCAPELYRLLWERNAKGETCPGIHLPDTILFGDKRKSKRKGNKKKKKKQEWESDWESDWEWYFTSKKTNQILRKHSRHCTREHVLEDWSKELRKGQRSPTDCVACLFEPSGETGPHLSPDKWTTVEFFDWFGTEAFLGRDGVPKNGFIQKVVRNKEQHNSVICATWSPNLCLVERRTNCNRIDDSQTPLHERMITFEGNESFRLSSSTPLSGTKVAELVQRACESIVEHVKEVSSLAYKIVRLVAYFKVDSSFQVSLLWCSSLRLEHRIPRGVISNSKDESLNAEGSASGCMLASLSVNLDPNVRVKRGTTLSRKQGRRILRSGDFTCPSCKESFESREKCEVMYKTVIAHFEKHLAGRNKEAVPCVLVETEGPSLSWKRYVDVVGNPAFLYKVCYMCISCCLNYTSTALEDLSTANPASTMVGITGEFSEPELESYNIVNVMMNDSMKAGEKGRSRPQSASAVQSRRGAREETARRKDKILQNRPNSASAAKLTKRSPLKKKEDFELEAAPLDENTGVKSGRIAFGERDDGNQTHHDAQLSSASFLDNINLEESESEFVATSCDDIPMEKIMKINDLTAEELEYLKAVLD